MGVLHYWIDTVSDLWTHPHPVGLVWGISLNQSFGFVTLLPHRIEEKRNVIQVSLVRFVACRWNHSSVSCTHIENDRSSVTCSLAGVNVGPESHIIVTSYWFGQSPPQVYSCLSGAELSSYGRVWFRNAELSTHYEDLIARTGTSAVGDYKVGLSSERFSAWK